MHCDGVLWAGVDIGIYTSAICVVDDLGRIVYEGVSDSTPEKTLELLAPYREQIKLVGAEAGVGTHLVRSLMAAGLPVAPFECRHAGKLLTIYRNKTDRNDAAGLAQIARLAENVVPTVHVKTIELQRIRNWLKLRGQANRQRMGVEDAIKSLFRVYGVRVGSIGSSKALLAAVERALDQLASDDREDVKEDITPLVSVALGLRASSRRLETRIRKFCEGNDVCRRFTEIPGVGPICATSFFTTIEIPSRFANTYAVGAYLGLTPRVRTSGRLIGRPRISKMGDTGTRNNLILAARAILRPATKAETALRTWGLQVAKRNSYRKAEIATARKLAITMLAMWKQNSNYAPYPQITMS